MTDCTKAANRHPIGAVFGDLLFRIARIWSQTQGLRRLRKAREQRRLEKAQSRRRARTREIVESLPADLQRDIGWPKRQDECE